jgi:hypothetical protein
MSKNNFTFMNQIDATYPESRNVGKFNSFSGSDLRIDQSEVGLRQLHERVHRGDAENEVLN